MFNHFAYCSVSLTGNQWNFNCSDVSSKNIASDLFTGKNPNKNNRCSNVSIKKPLTREAVTSSMKNLTKTNSGLSQPSFMRFFCAYLMALSRLFYDGLRKPNKRPFEGISFAVCWRLVITRHPKLNRVAITKLKPTGGHYA